MRFYCFMSIYLFPKDCSNLEIYTLQLSDYEKSQYDAYVESGGYIQEDMPTLNPVECEFILTGYCPECQKAIFGNGKTKRIKRAKPVTANCR